MVILQKFCLKMAYFNSLFMKIISVEKAVKVHYSSLVGSHLYNKGFVSTSNIKIPRSQNCDFCQGDPPHFQVWSVILA